jgi:hypothetical protein
MKSVVLGVPCRHAHPLYRQARDCGYKRGKLAGTGESHVVDATGHVVDPERGAALDVALEDAAREERQAGRDAEIKRLRTEQRDIDLAQWWNPLRPRERGE